MAGIFDTGIFDHNSPTGIFDHFEEAVAPRGTILPPPGGGWKNFKKGRKEEPKREELIAEVAEVVEEAVPQVTDNQSRIIAIRLVEQMTWAQLVQIETLDAFIARVEAEVAEMDDEEVLLLAA